MSTSTPINADASMESHSDAGEGFHHEEARKKTSKLKKKKDGHHYASLPHHHDSHDHEREDEHEERGNSGPKPKATQQPIKESTSLLQYSISPSLSSPSPSAAAAATAAAAPTTHPGGSLSHSPSNLSNLSAYNANDPSTHTPAPRNNAFVFILTAFSAIGGLLFGYDTGIVSGAMLLINDQFDLSTVQQEAVVSSAIGGAILGALSGGKLNEMYGRKPVIILSSFIFMAGAIVMAVAPGWEVLVVGRIIVGVAIGLASMTVPVFIAEAAPAHLRGKLVTINNLFITGGQFIAAVVAGGFSKVDEGWRYMLGIAALPALIQFIGFFYLPESPRYLFDKGKSVEAERILIKIRGTARVQEELEEIKRTVEQEASLEPVSIRELFSSSPIRRALFVGCMLQFFQQADGINLLMYYSATILRMAGFTDNSEAIWLAAAVAFANFAFTVVGVYIVDRAGRRFLLLSSLSGVTVSLVLIGIAFFLGQINPYHTTVTGTGCGVYNTCNDCVMNDGCGYCPPSGGSLYGSCVEGNSTGPYNGTACSESDWAHNYCPLSNWWLALVALILYIACFAPGMGPMPWTINSEIYPLRVRSFGISASTTVNWSVNLVVSMTFLTLSNAITQAGAFWLYAALSLLSLIFVWVFVPETKGRTLEQIEELFTDQYWMKKEARSSTVPKPTPLGSIGKGV